MTTLRHFRKKPITIEGMQFDGTLASASAICRWANEGADEPNCDYTFTTGAPDEIITDLICHTLEGPLNVSATDVVLKGVKGEFYPCKEDILALTYDEVFLIPDGVHGTVAIEV